MWRRFWLASMLVFVPGVTWAQTAPERFLPGGSQVYLAWDGIDKHRAAFDKTALGKMMKEETGQFLSALWTYLNDLMEVGLRQADPQAAQFAREIPAVFSGIHHNGFVLGIEVKALNPPQVQGVIVFPKGGSGPLPALMEKLAALAGNPARETKAGKRVVREIGDSPVRFGWWVDGADLVLVVGTGAPADLANAVDSPSGSFAQSKTYAKIAAFKEFPTWARGHLDLAGLFDKVGELAPQAEQIISQLGIKGLEGVTLHSGFEGQGERSVVQISTPGERKGLLALMNRKTIKLADLPPLPNDITSFSASNFNPRSIYEGGLTIAEAALNVFAGGAVNPREIVKQAEALVGIKFGEDLFGSFGDMFVSYGSPSEGPFGLSGAYVFKVKEEKKLGDSLEGLFKGIAAFIPVPGIELNYKKRAYRGGEIMDVKLKAFGSEYPIANMTIHKGWFVLGSYPQSVYGFILRSNGELPTWKMDADVTKALTPFPKEFTAISISDPRPTVQGVLAFAPTVLTLANSFLPNLLPGAPIFDVSVIPHAQDATRHLYPNITVTTDDGKMIRSDTRASLALPF